MEKRETIELNKLAEQFSNKDIPKENTLEYALMFQDWINSNDPKNKIKIEIKP